MKKLTNLLLSLMAVALFSPHVALAQLFEDFDDLNGSRDPLNQSCWSVYGTGVYEGAGKYGTYGLKYKAEVNHDSNDPNSGRILMTPYRLYDNEEVLISFDLDITPGHRGNPGVRIVLVDVDDNEIVKAVFENHPGWETINHSLIIDGIYRVGVQFFSNLYGPPVHENTKFHHLDNLFISSGQEIPLDPATCKPDYVLSVELEDFQAKTEGALVALQWKITADSDALSFEVERAAGNGHFEVIGQVSGQSGQQVYTLLDSRPKENNTYQYRLRMIDTNGKVTTSRQVEVQVASTTEEALYYDLSGRLVFQGTRQQLLQRNMPVNVVVERLNGASQLIHLP